MHIILIWCACKNFISKNTANNLLKLDTFCQINANLRAQNFYSLAIFQKNLSLVWDMQYSFILLYFVLINDFLNFKKSLDLSILQVDLEYLLAIVKHKAPILIKNELLYILVLLANQFNLGIFFYKNFLKKFNEVSSRIWICHCIDTDNIFAHQVNYQVLWVRRKHNLNFHAIFYGSIKCFIIKRNGN